MCKRNEESMDHLLLLHCDVASAIWSAFFSRFGMSWVMPRCVGDMYDCWWSFGKPRSAVVWKWCLHASFGVCEGK
jgi:hypothetical protein